jgi:hypothetical protein
MITELWHYLTAAGQRRFLSLLDEAFAELQDGDPKRLTDLAESVKVTVRLNRIPAYRRAAIAADVEEAEWREAGCPPREGRPVAEAIAELRAMREQS